MDDIKTMELTEEELAKVNGGTYVKSVRGVHCRCRVCGCPDFDLHTYDEVFILVCKSCGDMRVVSQSGFYENFN